MSEYLENYDNLFVQIFNEFYTFLYVVQYDCKSNLTLHNVMLDSKKIHIRALCDFFSNQRKQDDDLIYTDFINSQVDLSVQKTTDLKRFINKSTAHISKKRGTLKFPEKDFLDVTKALICRINRYIAELDKNLKREYKVLYDDEKVQKMRKNVLTQVLAVAVYNANKGEPINL